MTDQPTESTSPLPAVLSCLLAVAVFSWLTQSAWDTVVDDAYISARYAEHFSRGDGLVYNAGLPPVEGITNLAWTVLLGIGRSFGVPALTLMTTLGWLFGALTVVFAALLSRTLAQSNDLRITVSSWLIALSPHFVVTATNGLESSMMACAVVAATWAHLTLTGQGRWLAGAFTGALILTRPEGIAVALALIAHDHWQHRANQREALPHTAVALGTQLLLTIWRLFTYGAWLPNTFAAKSSFPLHTTFEVNGPYLTPEIGVFTAAGVSMVAIGVSRPHTLNKALVACLVLGLTFIPFTVNMWMPGLRLFMPAFSLLACLLALLVSRAGVLTGWPIALALVGSMGMYNVTDTERVQHYDWRHTVAPRNATQIAAEHLAAHAPPHAWLATRDAGVFAYYVGPDVHVAELHQRALTLPHPGGANTDIRANCPINPDFFAATIRRDNTPEFIYGGDKLVFKGMTEPYVYLGRIKQHYHRYYDVYARAALNVPPFPPGVVENFNGPKPRTLDELQAPEEQALPDDEAEER